MESTTKTLPSLTLINDTFSDNAGGAILNYDTSTLNMSNSILVGSTSIVDCANHGTLGTHVDNWIQADYLCSATWTGSLALEGLADNRGFTQTMALPDGSPAISAGDATACANAKVGGVDQRGAPRPQGTGCELGAYELDTTPPSILSISRYKPLKSTTKAKMLVFRVAFSENVQYVDASDFSVDGGTTAGITKVTDVGRPYI